MDGLAMQARVHVVFLKSRPRPISYYYSCIHGLNNVGLDGRHRFKWMASMSIYSYAHSLNMDWMTFSLSSLIQVQGQHEHL